MRKLMGLAGMLAVGLLGTGCAMTGGICDCAPIPGDSTGYNPHVTYHATCPIAPPVKVVPTATVPVSTGGEFEGIGAPKTMPKN